MYFSAFIQRGVDKSHRHNASNILPKDFMKYKYEQTCESSKLIYAKDLQGVPKDIELLFNSAHVRFYRSNEYDGYFVCTLAVPAFTDEDGYVRELEFFSPTDDDGLEDAFGSGEYSSQLNMLTFETLPKAVKCSFGESTEMGKRLLLFNLRIQGTPFNGVTLIDQDFYKENGGTE